MNEQRAKGMLGLAVRAREACFGDDACRKLIESGKCGIILLDEETGPNTRKKYEELCGRTGITLAILPQGLMEEATGRSNRVAALRKGAFAEQMTACL
ncbi:MAG: hypothetical protein ABS897_06235 [Eubacteriales bacterium]